MDNSSSQNSLDNSILFAHCAKDWNCYSNEESHDTGNTVHADGNTYGDCAELKNLNRKSSGLSKQKINNKQNEKLSSDQREIDLSHDSYAENSASAIATSTSNIPMFLTEQETEQEDAIKYEGTIFTRLYSILESAFIQHIPLSYAQSEAKAKELLLFPKQNNNWHLCLRGYHAHNISENAESVADSELHDPLEGAVSWLTEGIEKGWLRHVDIEAFARPLHHAFLSQERFWQCFASACDRKNNHLSLVLFEIAETAQKKKETLELIEQILIVTKNQDFFGEIKGFGVALVLPDSGRFGATACAESILSRMGKVLQNISIKVGVAEAEGGDNVDALFAHAKEALANNQEDGREVQVYRSMKKNKENNSLVQSDEKRFLFFGVQ